MGKFVFFSLVLIVGLAINPTARAKLAPHLAPALDPVYEWQTRSRVSAIGRTLEAERLVSLPATDSALSVFLSRQYLGSESPHLDPWGTPYFLVRSGYANRVASAGRDRMRYTADDIISPPY